MKPEAAWVVYHRIEPEGWQGSPTPMDFLAEVEAEIYRARAKFPGNEHMYVALAEEVGEVANALLEGSEGLRAECVQVAAMAMRLAEEGDADFGNRKERAMSDAPQGRAPTYEVYLCDRCGIQYVSWDLVGEPCGQRIPLCDGVVRHVDVPREVIPLAEHERVVEALKAERDGYRDLLTRLVEKVEGAAHAEALAAARAALGEQR